MKKTSKIFIIIIVMFMIVLVGCDNKNSNNITYDITYINDNKAVDVYMFSISDIKIEANNKGIITTTPCTEDMITSPTDLQKLEEVGTHTVIVSYEGVTKIFTVILVNSEGAIPYYANSAGKTGTELKLALRTIISVTTHTCTYDELKTILPRTDRGTDDPNKILLFYLRTEISAEWDPNTSTAWNREHIWPKSQGWFQTSGAGADPHHIRASQVRENSLRSNLPYGENGYGYEPIDEVKGDCARIIFYMLTRYSESDSFSVTRVAQSMQMLLRWNELDPVDSIETYRNNTIYDFQGNRNPFIDDSDYAYMIWDTSKLEYNVSGEKFLYTGIQDITII